MRKRIMTAILCAAAGLAALSVAGVASAASEPRSAGQLVAPSAVADGTPVYSSDQLSIAWTAVRTSFTAALPSGYQLPTTLPEEMKAVDADHKVFVEPAFFDMRAANYWRCSTLDASFATGATLSDSQVSEILKVYASLPSISKYDLTGYSLKSLKNYAVNLGQPDAAHALFALDCQGFQK